MPRWKKLPPLPGRVNPCLNCPPIVPTFRLNRRIAVGFGDAHVSCDGTVIWLEPIGPEAKFEDAWTGMRAENRARKNPNHDWRITLFGPLHGEVYQRQGRNRWVLVKTNPGFA